MTNEDDQGVYNIVYRPKTRLILSIQSQFDYDIDMINKKLIGQVCDVHETHLDTDNYETLSVLPLWVASELMMDFKLQTKKFIFLRIEEVNV